MKTPSKWITINGRHIPIYSKMPEDIENELLNDDDYYDFYNGSGSVEDEYEEEMKHDAELERQRQKKEKSDSIIKKKVDMNQLKKVYENYDKAVDGWAERSVINTLQEALLYGELTESDKEEVRRWLDDLCRYNR